MDKLQVLQKDFETYLMSNLPKTNSFYNDFNDALAHTLKASAKRFRPMLIIGIVQALNPLLVKNSFDIALGIEIFHTYSLIHDDLPCMDNASLRRGVKTLHLKYDETTAVLVGDGLNTYTFGLLSNAKLSSDIKIQIIQSLSSDGGLGGMLIGQAIDCHYENKPLDLEQLKFLHIHKTAKLIATSLKIGAIICELDNNTQKQLYDFGIDLGLLFQIQDDIIDETQSEKMAGKTTSNDTDKNSFVNLLGLDGAIDEANKLSLKCRQTIDNFNLDLKTILQNLLNPYLNRHL